MKVILCIIRASIAWIIGKYATVMIFILFGINCDTTSNSIIFMIILLTITITVFILSKHILNKDVLFPIKCPNCGAKNNYYIKTSKSEPNTLIRTDTVLDDFSVYDDKYNRLSGTIRKHVDRKYETYYKFYSYICNNCGTTIKESSSYEEDIID